MAKKSPDKAKPRKRRSKKLRPPLTLRLKNERYQPTKAELEEDMSIDASPIEIARAVLRPVRIEHEAE